MFEYLMREKLPVLWLIGFTLLYMIWQLARVIW